jgi:3-oxochol-4-en-24-oyl-CoA dehydrogenase
MLAITEEHHDLADAAMGALTRLKSREAARIAHDTGATSAWAPIFRQAAELGWTGLAVAEEYGGSGFGPAELAIVLEAQGHQLCPGPFLPTVAASLVIDRCAPDGVRAQLLPGLVDGSTVGALGLAGRAVLEPDLVISGEFPAVLGAPDADVLVLGCGDDVVVVDADLDGVVVSTLTALDGTRSVGTVTLTDVRVSADRVLRGAARSARTVFRVLAAAEAVGSSWACVEMARDHVKVREQFGRPIGSFQAVKHHAADMLIAAEQATAATWDAARSTDLDSAWFAGAVASAHAIRAQVFTAQKNIQLHGGVGYTWEHDAHLYLKRLLSWSAFLGGPDRYLVQLGAQFAESVLH